MSASKLRSTYREEDRNERNRRVKKYFELEGKEAHYELALALGEKDVEKPIIPLVASAPIIIEQLKINHEKLKNEVNEIKIQEEKLDEEIKRNASLLSMYEKVKRAPEVEPTQSFIETMENIKLKTAELKAQREDVYEQKLLIFDKRYRVVKEFEKKCHDNDHKFVDVKADKDAYELLKKEHEVVKNYLQEIKTTNWEPEKIGDSWHNNYLEDTKEDLCGIHPERDGPNIERTKRGTQDWLAERMEELDKKFNPPKVGPQQAQTQGTAAAEVQRTQTPGVSTATAQASSAAQIQTLSPSEPNTTKPHSLEDFKKIAEARGSAPTPTAVQATTTTQASGPASSTPQKSEAQVKENLLHSSLLDQITQEIEKRKLNPKETQAAAMPAQAATTHGAKSNAKEDSANIHLLYEDGIGYFKKVVKQEFLDSSPPGSSAIGKTNKGRIPQTQPSKTHGGGRGESEA